MALIVIFDFLISFAVYLFVGFSSGKNTKNVGDLLPLALNGNAKVKNAAEFSSSTVATTVSLATFIVAFFELADYFGYWLFWTVITTSIGLLIVRLLAPRIWNRLSEYQNTPSLHEFLGKEFGSKTVSVLGALATSMGFLGVFALELTVGSRFLATLIGGVPEWIVVILLSVIAFVYTSLGGFRAVIRTDKLQMWSIWLLILSLLGFYIYFISTNGGWQFRYDALPESIRCPAWGEQLIPFLLAIFMINIPFYVADMSLWQRIGASKQSQTIKEGLGQSVLISAMTLGLLVVLAIFSFMIIPKVTGQNALITLLQLLGNEMGIMGKILLFLSVLGLYGAMLSTASTQLISVSHTIYEDVVSKLSKKSLTQRLESPKELFTSRFILIASALVATTLVEILSYYGFTIRDLIFAVYGAQLGLTPAVLLALFVSRKRLYFLSKWANLAIILAFVSGWGLAIVGKLQANQHFIDLAPSVSFGISLSILLLGFLINYRKK
jgi:Na+/proline symporter